MIFGIGCDVCALDHLEKSLSGPHAAAFVRRVYGPAECTALALDTPLPAGHSGAHRLASAAADFAAKEAFLKAAGTGLREPFALREIEAVRLESGASLKSRTVILATGARWRQMNQTKVVFLNDGTAPRGVDTWMLYQALAGAWPATLHPQDEAGINELRERFLGFVEKALREAKIGSNWSSPDVDYEQKIAGFIEDMLGDLDWRTILHPSHA